MKSTKLRVVYLLIVILFLVVAGFLWLDYIGLMDLNKYHEQYISESTEKSINAKDDEPSLLAKEELKKRQERLDEKAESLSLKEIKLKEIEKSLSKKEEQLNEKAKGLDLEAKKLEEKKKRYESYRENINDLARKIGNMPPEGAIKIMSKWDDLLVIDVLRRMDQLAAQEDRQSITSYLLFLMQQNNPERAGTIMRKMAETTPEPS